MKTVARLVASLALPVVALAQTTVPYPGPLTNTRREVVNFNAEPVRALAFGSDGALYTINTHGSQLVWHTNLDGVPDMIGQTVLNPVSLAMWGNDRVLVAGAGTHALALHDRTTFDILDVLQLPSEPADIVVDPDLDCAFVSCQGADVVVKVDLASFAIVTQYPIPNERPRFLSFDRGAADTTTDNRVIAASFLSGNGSVIVQPVVAGGHFVIADPVLLGAPAFSPPDEDLFSIDVNGTGAAAVTAVKRRVGTMLTAHGMHPNGTYWALNINSLNADPLEQSEPLLRGDFVRNQAWRGALGTPAGFALPTEQTDLDLGTGGYSTATATAFPYGIAFAPPTDGRVYITSPLDDLVSIRNSSGVELQRIGLNPGTIPLDVELWPFSNDLLFTYCFGTNEVLVHVVSNPSLVFPLSLGVDPTPEPIKRGRAIWYDGNRSLNARTSCNSCHPGGKSEFIGWQISDEPSDRKDVMVTQSLLGIEDSFPYHWRGERDLQDFNGAFVDLLGGSAKLTEGPGSEFEDFQAFVFSLALHANPRESMDRTLPSIQEVVSTGGPAGTVSGNPAQGVTPFLNVIGFNGQTCAECHIPQSGSNGDFIFEVATDIPTAGVLEVPHLRELRHKDQPIVPLGGAIPRARSGFGIAHNGFSNDIFTFVSAAVFNLQNTEPQDVAAFVRRFDHGIAPISHAALMLDFAHQANAATISGTWLTQAGTANRWIDVVAFGKFRDPATNTTKVGRWWFNPATGLFDCNDTNVTSQPFGTFSTQAGLSQCVLAFVGLPPGNGFRFALDPDHDSLIDSKEWVQGTSAWDPDSDNDGQNDGYEVRLGSDPMNPAKLGTDTTGATGTAVLDFKSASLAKVEINANEDVRVSASFQRPGGPVHVSESPVFGRLTTLALQGLEPSTPATAPNGPFASVFSCTLTLRDFSNNPSTIVMTPFTAGDMLHPLGVLAAGSPLVVSTLSGSKSSAGGAMTITGQVNLQQRFNDAAGVNGTAVNNRVVVLHVIRETAANSNMFVIDPAPTPTIGTLASAITVADAGGAQRTLPATVLPGPFLLTAATTTTGIVPYGVTVSGLNANELVRIRVVAILEPHPTVANAFVDVTLGLYHLPPTAIDMRGLEFQFP